jgi:hypothetical protein
MRRERSDGCGRRDVVADDERDLAGIEAAAFGRRF